MWCLRWIQYRFLLFGGCGGIPNAQYRRDWCLYLLFLRHEDDNGYDVSDVDELVARTKETVINQ